MYNPALSVLLVRGDMAAEEEIFIFWFSESDCMVVPFLREKTEKFF
jgi:hypothetical protein